MTFYIFLNLSKSIKINNPESTPIKATVFILSQPHKALKSLSVLPHFMITFSSLTDSQIPSFLTKKPEKVVDHLSNWKKIPPESLIDPMCPIWKKFIRKQNFLRWRIWKREFLRKLRKQMKFHKYWVLILWNWMRRKRRNVQT